MQGRWQHGPEAGRHGRRGTNTGSGEGLRLRLQRVEQGLRDRQPAAKSTRTDVRLHALRKLDGGSYTLVVTVGETTVRIPVALC